MKIICENCGTPNNKGATYCSFCYKKLEKTKKGKKKDSEETPPKINYSQQSSLSSGFTDTESDSSGFNGSSGGSLADRIAASKKNNDNKQNKEKVSVPVSSNNEQDPFDMQSSGFMESPKTPDAKNDDPFNINSGFVTSELGTSKEKDVPDPQNNNIPKEDVADPVQTSEKDQISTELTQKETDSTSPKTSELSSGLQDGFSDDISADKGKTEEKNSPSEYSDPFDSKPEKEDVSLNVEPSNNANIPVLTDKKEEQDNTPIVESSGNDFEKKPEEQPQEQKVVAKKVVIGKQKKKTPANNKNNQNKNFDRSGQQESKHKQEQTDQSEEETKNDVSEEDLFLRSPESTGTSEQKNKTIQVEDPESYHPRKPDLPESTDTKQAVSADPEEKYDYVENSSSQKTTESNNVPQKEEKTIENKDELFTEDLKISADTERSEQSGSHKNDIADTTSLREHSDDSSFEQPATKSFSDYSVDKKTEMSTPPEETKQVPTEQTSGLSGFEHRFDVSGSDDGFLTDKEGSSRVSSNNPANTDSDQQKNIPSLAERVQQEQKYSEQEINSSISDNDSDVDRTQNNYQQNTEREINQQRSSDNGFVLSDEPKKEDSGLSKKDDITGDNNEEPQVKKEGFFTIKKPDNKPAQSSKQQSGFASTESGNNGFFNTPVKHNQKQVLSSHGNFSGIKTASAEKQRLQPYGPSIRVMDEIVYDIVSTKEGIIVTNNPTTNNAFRALDGTIIEKQPLSEDKSKNNLLKKLPYDGYYDDVIPSDFENEETMKFDKFDKETLKKVGIIVGIALAAFIIAAIVFIYF